ncbi:MAG TPA: 5'/3'-nucleotidase SurE, partial [Candidatus Ozemobacteraceae bacterium]|nr:5'/3'-nucleotidase SurE [Candidatus Ozemobacteraceae bacterium]
MKINRLCLLALVCIVMLTGFTPAGAQEARPHIMVVNDDGITSDGIMALVRALETFADVTVCAPTQ